jgi:hypothetical protein
MRYKLMMENRGGRKSQDADALAAWVRLGSRLAEVDWRRFRRLLAITRGVVATYDGTDLENSGDLHEALLRIASDSAPFEA